MGFFDKVKSAAGVGTASLEVDVNSRPTKRGDALQCLIRVTPGERPYRVNYIRYSFECNGEWPQTQPDGSQVYIEGKMRIAAGDIEASRGVQVEGVALEYPIEARVPAAAPLSSKDVEYKLWVRVDLEGTQDPEKRIQFEIKE